MVWHLRRQGYRANRKRVRRLMQTMGLAAIYQKPSTSRTPHPAHEIYLLPPFEREDLDHWLNLRTGKYKAVRQGYGQAVMC